MDILNYHEHKIDKRKEMSTEDMKRIPYKKNIHSIVIINRREKENYSNILQITMIEAD